MYKYKFSPTFLNPLTPGPSFARFNICLSVKSVNEILWCYHSHETALIELLHGSVFLQILKKEI